MLENFKKLRDDIDKFIKSEELSKKYSVKYVYSDYRHTYYEGQKKAREYGLYMQKYCGCVFSFDAGKWVY